MQSLERFLPDALKQASIVSGGELVLPYLEALSAVGIATEHGIAILGLEAFEVKEDGLLTVDLSDASSYVLFTGNWEEYVARMNREAEHWIQQHRLGENHGYILTSTSESEFATLSDRLK